MLEDKSSAVPEIEASVSNSTGPSLSPVEIELKYLVDLKSLSLNLSDYPHEKICQGFVSLDGKSAVRLRQKGDKYYFTVKSGDGIERSEYEMQVEKSFFDYFWETTAGRRIEKVRYEIAGPDELTYELDVYEGEGLEGFATVEVEFSQRDEAAAFQAPEWFGRDVTSDRRYTNASIALNGLPES